MSAAAAADAGASPPKGKKKLIIMIVAALLVLAIGGGAAMFLMKKKASADDEEGAEAETTHAPAAKAHSGTPPTFVPLDPFTVNLADRESERYAQIALTLEVDDAHFADQIKLYMPAIRNNILLVLAHKTATELLQHEGKLKLAAEIAREAVKPMGIEIEDEDDEAVAEEAAAPKKKKKKKRAVHNPVTQVLFSNFIIQ